MHRSMVLLPRHADAADIEQLIVSLLYADDMAIVCKTSKDLETIVARLDEVLW